MGFVTKEKLFSKDFFITYGWLLGGCFVFALGAVLFAEPYGFAPGGTYGLSMVFHHLWGWETEIAALCMDVPLLLLGIYFLGGMFGVKTIICTFAIPAFMRLIHYLYGYDALLEPGITDRTMLNEQLLSAIFGGIVYGIGIGMIFKARATSGGSDIISMILNKYTHISLGTLVIIVDCTITLSTVVAFGDWRLPMYSWIIVFIEGKVIDLIVEGASVHKTLMIVTKEMDTVKNIILNDINRGATILPAIGAYKGESREMIYTILTRREMMVLRHKIREIDPEAFINVIDSREILGKGFKWMQNKKRGFRLFFTIEYILKKSRKALFLIHIRDIPDKCPDTVFFIHFVQILDIFQDQRDHFVFHDGHGGGVHLRPGMSSHSGFSIHGSSPVDQRPLRESSYL